MSDLQQETRSMSSKDPEAMKKLRPQATNYIPISGGIMTWHGHSGLLAYEKPNNYLFYQVAKERGIDIEVEKRNLLLKRRKINRLQLEEKIKVNVNNGQQKDVVGFIVDVSMTGMKILLDSQSVPTQESIMQLRVVASGHPLDGLKVDAKLKWADEAVNVRGKAVLGIAFKGASSDTVKVIKKFLLDKEAENQVAATSQDSP